MAIQALPFNTVHALGSSQVLQDSAAVVKELLDNALDAGATSVVVEVSSNLLDLIQVRDNGIGVSQEDRKLLSHRHCTSKIASEDDLRRIGGSWLGFRGEALASMAELSGSLSIATRVEGEQIATAMTFDRSGKITSTAPASLPVGTSVKVTDFMQTNPVRRRLALKSSRTTLLKITHIMQAYALARHRVRLSFRILKSNGKDDFLYAPNDVEALLDVVSKLFGVACSSQCNIHEAEYEGYALRACLPRIDSDFDKVSGARPFINCDGRPMSSSKGTFQQICKAFRTALQAAGIEVSKAANIFFALRISCEPGCYDVNVEPAKDDVIFRDSETVLLAARTLFDGAYGSRSKISLASGSIGADFNNQLPTPLPSSDSGPVESAPHLASGISPFTESSQPTLFDRGTSSRLATPAGPRGKIKPPRSELSAHLEALTEQSILYSTDRAKYGLSPPNSLDKRYVSQSSNSRRRGVNRPFVQPPRQSERERVWFDHLEAFERSGRVFRPSQHQTNSQMSRSRKIGDLADDPRPLSPPPRNQDIRSFCKPRTDPVSSHSIDSRLQATSTDAPVLLAAAGNTDDAPRLDSSCASVLSAYPHSNAYGQSSEGATETTRILPGVSKASSSVVISAPPSPRKQPVSIPQREVSAQLLAFTVTSPAAKLGFVLRTPMEEIESQWRLMSLEHSILGISQGNQEEMVSLAQVLDEGDITAVSRLLERKLLAADCQRLTVLRLRESIAAAIESRHYVDVESETDLLM